MKLICELYEICMDNDFCEHAKPHEFLDKRETRCNMKCPITQKDLKIKVENIEKIKTTCISIAEFRKKKLNKINENR